MAAPGFLGTRVRLKLGSGNWVSTGPGFRRFRTRDLVEVVVMDDLAMGIMEEEVKVAVAEAVGAVEITGPCFLGKNAFPLLKFFCLLCLSR